MRAGRLLVGLFLLAWPLVAQQGSPTTRLAESERRRQLAESRAFLRNSPAATTASSAELVEAMDLGPGMVISSTVTGAAPANAVLANLGIIQPRRGGTFALLSTGVAGTTSPEPGTDFAPAGTEGDRATLTLTLAVPAGDVQISFNYNFLSSEYPEFIGTIFNDTFVVTLTDAAGTREIAHASVNSSTFFPAASSRAAGSGFDIFTADPSGVDTEFGGGLPDAGLTDFLSVSSPAQSTGQITLQFSIEDQGDGILDSAVLLDNLIVTSLEALDVNPDFRLGSEITTGTEQLATTAGTARDGAAADGVTLILLRVPTSGPGTVSFSLEGGNAPEDGGVSEVGGNPTSTSVTVPVVSTSMGFRAFAEYRSPADFDRGTDAGAAYRALTFKATFHPTGGGPSVDSLRPFKIVRPPVVLVHGLWSDPATWTFTLATDPKFSVTLADYHTTNASHFSQNSGAVKDGIHKALLKMNELNYAATQADLASHSMGGLLSRIWTTSSSYSRNDNFNQGDIHKLVTLDTPHTGSPLANLLVVLRDTPLIGGLVTSLANTLHKPIDQGAIDDLANGSTAIQSIGPAPIPCHALVGTGGSDALALLPGELGAFYRMVSFFADLGFFQGLQHDGIVGRQSQEGGLPTNAISVFGGVDGIHIFNPGSSAYSSRTVELFNSPVTSAAFAHFPATATLSAANPAIIKTQMMALVRPVKSVQPGLLITSPSTGAVVEPGSVIHVTVVPAGGALVERVLVVGPGLAEIDEIAPFDLTVTVPAAAVGPLTLQALGANTAGDYYTSNDVTIQVTPTASLTSLALIPRDPILLRAGDTAQLFAIGSFADGVQRDITAPGQGTVFTSARPEIATVSPGGLVTAVAPGLTTIVASNAGVQDSIVVTVLDEPGPVISVVTIPTLSHASLIVFALLLIMASGFLLRRGQ